MMRKIYLAGHINPNFPGTLAWRTLAYSRLRSNFDVISPIKTASLADDQQALQWDGAMETEREAREIFLACHEDVRQADIILAMLNDFGSPRPMRGTYFELAWAWERHMPIIGVIDHAGDEMLDPFLSSVVTAWKVSLTAAVDHLIEVWA